MNNVELLEKLVSFNTIEDKDNYKIMDFIGNYLYEMGFDIKYVENKEKTKKCLIARFREPNLMFIGHTDTVDYSNWNTDPFKLTRDGNKLHGLGTCDMKGGIAAFLGALNEIDLNELNKGVQMVLTFDEEKGFEGIRLVKDYQNDWPNNVIVGEPTSLIPVTNTKGCMEYKVTFEGKAAHSSTLNKGKNAIIASYNFMKELLLFGEELKKETNPLFEIPYTTMNIAIINGGRAVNIVPDACELTFDFRTIKTEQHAIIKNKLNDLCKKYQAELFEITNLYPLENNMDTSFYEDITGNKKKSFNFVTEASFLDKDNVIILGVGPNNEHMPNEYVDEDSYNETIKVYKKIINHYCK